VHWTDIAIAVVATLLVWILVPVRNLGMKAVRLRSGVLRTRDDVEGWSFRVDPVLPLSDRFPRGPRTTVLVIVLLLGAAFGLSVALAPGPLAQMDSIHRLLIVAADAASCAVAVWVLQNPLHRFRTTPKTGYFAYARDAEVLTYTDRFDATCLGSTVLDPSLGPPGRVGLAFTNTAGRKVELVGWPGLYPSDAEHIQAFVLERVGALKEA
jgi:hypothetical protein